VAAGAETSLDGALLLLTYGLGMTLPFILAAFFIGPFMRLMVKFRHCLGIVEKVMGIFLILFGLLIATNSMNYIAQWMLELLPNFVVLG
jgi:cytochrome c-type biogenesis protein